MTYGAGGSTRGLHARADQVDQAGPRHRGDGAPELRGRQPRRAVRDPRQPRRRRDRERAGAARAIRRGARPSGSPHPGGLRYSSELAALIASRYPFCVGAAASPRSIPRRRTWRSDLRFLKQKVDSGRLVPDHPAVLRQRRLLPVRRGGPRGRDRGPDHPGDHADHRRGPDQDDHRHVRRGDPDRAARAARVAGALTPTRCSSSGSPTRPCSAPSCSRAGAPGIHFYTLNRSPATRAILAALRLLRPWVRREVVRTDWVRAMVAPTQSLPVAGRSR